MKLTKKVVSYVLVFLMVFGSFTILPSEFWGWLDVSAVEVATEDTGEEQLYTENGFTYSIINSDEVKIVGYKGSNRDIVIPDIITDSEIPELQNKKITVLGAKTFWQTRITSLILGKYIKSIEYRAVYNNVSLTKVDLSRCENLTIIGESAFEQNTQTEKLFLPAGTNLTTIERYAFFGNNQLDEIDLSVCKGLKTIGDHAFYGDGEITTLCLDSIETIGDYAFAYCTYLRDVELGTNLKSIGYRAFLYTNYLINVNIKGGKDAVIGEQAFMCPSTDNEMYGVENLTIGNGVKSIGDHAFSMCSLRKVNISDTVKIIGRNAITVAGKSEVTIGKGVITMGENAINGSVVGYLVNIKILSENLASINRSLPIINTTIYCYKNSQTHKTLEDKGYSNILRFFASVVYPTNIKVNGVAVDNFTAENKEYTVYVDDDADVKIEAVLENNNASYQVTGKDNVYTINVLDENNDVSSTYTINIKLKPNYAVIGDVKLKLNNISSTKVGGSIALPAGTYKLKIGQGSQEFGYSKTITDYCNGLTVSEKYSSYITLKATGGIYTFQFDKNTNKLVIKHDSNLPNEYLIGDLTTVLKPVGDRPLSIGTQNLPEGTYKFKLSIGGKEHGYNKVINDAIESSMTVNSKYSAQLTLNATGGIYTFILNTETKKLIIRHTPAINECTTDVHISGDFNLVLNDKSSSGKELNMAIGNTYLEDGCHTFKVYNYGVAYTAGAILNDGGERTLSSKYTKAITLNATGGYYVFLFDKTTGVLEITKMG
ncbi:MAG: leucine-rich repeat protein [Acutalibacteraceae bacterium]